MQEDMLSAYKLGVNHALITRQGCIVRLRHQVQFQFLLHKKMIKRVTVICAAKECLWRVHASQVGNIPTFRIKSP